MKDLLIKLFFIIKNFLSNVKKNTIKVLLGFSKKVIKLFSRIISIIKLALSKEKLNKEFKHNDKKLFKLIRIIVMNSLWKSLPLERPPQIILR